MLRLVALLCTALIACGSRNTHGQDDARPVVHPIDAAPELDATSTGDGPVDIDAMLTLDGAPQPDGAPQLDAAPQPDGAMAHPDASPQLDAAMAQPDAGSTTPNTVSCYTQAAPATTCTLPTHCCFSNFDAQHNGDCTTAACAWGTISCDGPEDCAGGQRCCAHAIIDPNQGLTGYTLGCQAGPCGAAPANQELCHPGTCSTGTCVSALGHDNDLPRSLSICQ